MLTSSAAASLLDGGQVDLACFVVAKRVYAIDVCQVREIVRFMEVTPLPKAPSLIEGVIDLRGSLVPVIDLGHALGDAKVERTHRARIVILENDGLVFGLCVDSATDVLSIDAAALEDPPALAVQAGYDAIRAVVRRESSQPVMVLALEPLLENVYRSALSQNREGA